MLVASRSVVLINFFGNPGGLISTLYIYIKRHPGSMELFLASRHVAIEF